MLGCYYSENGVAQKLKSFIAFVMTLVALIRIRGMRECPLKQMLVFEFVADRLL